MAKLCIESGHSIQARWLDEDFSKTSSYTDADKIKIATIDAEDVWLSDALILLPSPRRIPGGKFVEAGIAIGLGHPVYVLGQRENMLLWHPLVQSFPTIEDLLKQLSYEQKEN